MRGRRVIFSCLLLAAAGQVVRGAGADPTPDIDAQYEAALVALKKPAVTGILITEVEPESAAAGAGLRAGDILTEYYGQRITTLAALREQVGEAVARRLEDVSAGKRVLVRVRRGGQEVTVQLPREPLGVRAVEVDAGVAGPRNVPPSPRGSLELNWKQVAAVLAAEKEPAAFRMLQRVAVGGGENAAGATLEEWVGWQVITMTPEGKDALAGKVDLYRLDAETPPKDEKDIPTEHSTFTFRLQSGDYKMAPAFVLDELGARYPVTAGMEVAFAVSSSKRLGERLQTTMTLTRGEDRPLKPTEHHENAAPLNALPQAGVPWVAAAMPHAANASLGLSLLSVRDFLARPGYVIVTRGKQPLPMDPNLPPPAPDVPAEAAANAVTGWRVDLTHVGVVIESYWFTDQCRLICVETQGTQPLVARRVDSTKTASTPQERKAVATRPATRPVSTAPAGAL